MGQAASISFLNKDKATLLTLNLAGGESITFIYKLIEGNNSSLAPAGTRFLKLNSNENLSLNYNIVASNNSAGGVINGKNEETLDLSTFNDSTVTIGVKTMQSAVSNALGVAVNAQQSLGVAVGNKEKSVDVVDQAKSVSVNEQPKSLGIAVSDQAKAIESAKKENFDVLTNSTYFNLFLLLVVIWLVYIYLKNRN